MSRPEPTWQTSKERKKSKGDQKFESQRDRTDSKDEDELGHLDEDGKHEHFDPNEMRSHVSDGDEHPSSSAPCRRIYDVRMAVVGNVDSGKSTLIGSMISGKLDDGRGLSRSKVFLHQHEAASGRTSCISQHIMGFDTQHKAVHQPVAASASSAAKNKSWKEVVSASRSIMTFIDLAGHEKYLKTTIAGLTGCFPDYALIIINSLAGVTKMTREHLGVSLALDIPLICIITKIDLAPENVLSRTKSQLTKILKSQAAKNKVPLLIRGQEDIQTALKDTSGKVVPIFLVSCVSGANLPLLLDFLSFLKPRRAWGKQAREQAMVAALQMEHAHDQAAASSSASSSSSSSSSSTKDQSSASPQAPSPSSSEASTPTSSTRALPEQGGDQQRHPSTPPHAAKADAKMVTDQESKVEDEEFKGHQQADLEPAEFHVDETFNVSGVGVVISGTVASGVIRINSHLLLGPYPDNTFKEVVVRSLQCKRVSVEECHAGDSCAMSLRMSHKRKDKDALSRASIRRGMVLVDPAVKPKGVRAFEAEVHVLHHPTTIKLHYQAVIHCGILRQTACIYHIDKDCLRTGDHALVRFRFMLRHEWLHAGSTFIFREGNTKGIGRIVRLIDDEEYEASMQGRQAPVPVEQGREVEAEGHGAKPRAEEHHKPPLSAS